jgi:hypothetical protein
MVKRRREDYTRIGEFKAPWNLPGIGRTILKITVLVDLDELLLKQAPLALANKYKHNKQTYGPFRVTVKELERKADEETNESNAD